MLRRYAFWLTVAPAFVLVTGPGQAQTTANGPYYATPSWDQQIGCASASSCPRFVVLANWVDSAYPSGGAAVLDRETGLVWLRSPGGRATWFAASDACVATTTGNRLGWRLPTVNEMGSLFDPSRTTAPFLPPGHPFQNMPLMTFEEGYFWTATATDVSGTPGHRRVGYEYSFGNSTWYFTPNLRTPDGAESLVWCVRGGLQPGFQ